MFIFLAAGVVNLVFLKIDILEAVPVYPRYKLMFILLFRLLFFVGSRGVKKPWIQVQFSYLLRQANVHELRFNSPVVTILCLN